MTRLEVRGLNRPSGLPVICQGAGSAGGGRNLYQVLDCQDQLIVKLFPSDMEKERVEEEIVNTMRVRSLGVEAPDIRALVEEGPSYGFAYVKVLGDTFLERISKGLGDLDFWAERFAFIHRGVHERDIDGLRTVKEGLERGIARSELKDRTKDAVLDALDSLPEGSGICHGDFHPGNVIAAERGFVIIDWAKVTSGHCLADVAMSSVLFDVWLPYKVRELDIRLSRRSIDFFHQIYLNSYLILSGESEDDLDAWRLPVAAARLAEANPWEREGLLEMIHKRV